MICEINHIHRYAPYCTRRARWTLSGVMLCGTHKRQLEAKAKDVGVPMAAPFERWPRPR